MRAGIRVSEQPDSSAASSNVLDDALARVRSLDPALAGTLSREVDALRDGRKFGLVFEKHFPESVRLPGHPIERGVKVSLQAPARGEESLAWRVIKVTGSGPDRAAHLIGREGSVPTTDLVVVRDFGEPVYPGLTSVDRIERAKPSDPTHLVINGENHHALQALRMTHRKAVDLIYIDPPYNTGNEGWIYNDRYVADQDAYKHSKWLSFMERRLKTARQLLKDTGVIVVAIGDDEHHRLRMLMDQIFGAKNFIANAVWQGGGSSLARHHAGGVDYMLIYGREAEKVGKFLDPKPHVPEMIRLVEEAIDRGATAEEAQAKLRAFIKANAKDMPEGVTRFNNVDPNGMIFETADLTNRLPRPNLRYPVTDPETGRLYDPPENGWTVKKDLMDEWVAAGLIAFGKRPRKKKALGDYVYNMPVPTFYHSRNTSNAHLERILGDKRFPFPKDHSVLMRWIRMTAPSDGVVLDFFGGSGTTTEAVMRLNVEDGGRRQCILVTNNEVSAKDAKTLRKAGHNPGDGEWEAKGVCRYVTQPRISTVVTGTRSDGSAYSESLPTNVEFFDLTYLDPDRVSRAREFESIAPLLWMKAGAVGECIAKEPSDGWAVSTGYAVLTDVDAGEPFLDALAVLNDPPPLVFVVTDSPSDFEDIASRLPRGVHTHRLYESYMRNFEINVEATQ